MSSPDGGIREVIKVRLLRAGKVIRSYKVRSDTFTIGSEKGCTMRAAGDPSVAPKHATIYTEDGELTLVPEQDALVHLNGEPVDFAIPTPDDVIKIGRLTFKVELASAMESLIPPAADAKTAAPKAAVPKAAVPKAAVSKAAVPKAAPKAAKKVVLPPKPAAPVKVTAPVSPVVPEALEAKLPSPFAAEKPVEKKPVEKKPVEKKPVEKKPVEKKPVAEKPASVDIPMEIESEKSADVSEETTIPKEVAPTPMEWDDGFDGEIDPAFYFSEDEEDEEYTFVEPFSLADALLEKKESREGPKESYCAAHVVRIANGRVAETAGVLPKTPYASDMGELECRIHDGRLVVSATSGLRGEFYVGGEGQDIASQRQKGGRYETVLGEGDSALLEGEGGTYKIEVYRPPLAPKKGSLRPSPRMAAIIGVAFMIHAVVGFAVAYVQPKISDKEEKKEEEVFAMVNMEKPEDPKPQEEIEIEDVEPLDAKEIAEKAPSVTAKQVKRVRARAKENPGGGSVSSLLQVLSKGSGKPGATNKLKDLISNIDAVPSKGGGSPFSIAGAIASLPGEGVNIARQGGGGAISTLSGEQVAGKGTGIGTLTKSKKKGKIRGKVTKMSSGARVGGSLSKADVSRVVNSHLHAVQACYEKALLNNPTLKGRISFDWTVSKTGKVKGVRVRSSTIGSPQVASCISKRIKRWKFPRPKGGDAKITYPFIFRAVH
ncbi:MAG: AgmX/PglI C-terminal domain-containing protein [Deltaproteobacteria bacterium]|nr:AgmX/PglI C-terminal domain-containing protein [Deltaproteobacteria bacterium]